MADEYAFTIATDDESDELVVPEAALDMLSDADQTAPEALGDMAMLMLAQQLHGAVHHAHGDADPDVVDAEAALMDAFEDRFGQTFGEMTGHDH